MMDILVASAPAFLVEHAVALCVAVPMVGAALVSIMPNGRTAWGVALALTVVSAWTSLIMLGQTLNGEKLSYVFGGWDPAWLGIEYAVDRFNAIVAVLVSLMGILALIYAPPEIEAGCERQKHPGFYGAFMLCFSGLLGVTLTGDAFNMFVFLEISSLSTYVLVAMGASRDRRALTAAFNYLILGTIGATFFVIGVGFLYAATGTLNMADLSARLPELSDSRTVRAAFAFILIGLGLKLAVFPLHAWLPNAYAFAPNVVTAFLASTATKVAFYALARFTFTIFDPQAEFVALSLMYILFPLALIGMVIASFQAVFQDDVKRLFALSSVAQVGYMVLGLSLATAVGVGAGFLHMVFHALMKASLFMAIGAAVLVLGVRRVEHFNGLGRTMPITMTAFTVSALSLVGVPLTAGFVSKWYLLSASFDEGLWWASAVIVFSSVLAFIYVGRILERAWLRKPPERAGEPVQRQIAPTLMLVPMVLLAAANIGFGIFAEPTAQAAQDAAACFLASANCPEGALGFTGGVR